MARSGSLARPDDDSAPLRGTRSISPRSFARSLSRAPSSPRSSSDSTSSSRTSRSRGTAITGVATFLSVFLERAPKGTLLNDFARRSTSLETSRWNPTSATPGHLATPKSPTESFERASTSRPTPLRKTPMGRRGPRSRRTSTKRLRGFSEKPTGPTLASTTTRCTPRWVLFSAPPWDLADERCSAPAASTPRS